MIVNQKESLKIIEDKFLDLFSINGTKVWKKINVSNVINECIERHNEFFCKCLSLSVQKYYNIWRYGNISNCIVKNIFIYF